MQTKFSRVLRLLPGRAVLGVLAAVAIAATSPPAAAQSLWMTRDTDRTIMFEMLHPSIEDVDSDLLSAAFFLSGRATVSSDIAVVVEVPYANHQSSQTFFGITTETSSSTLGDPYVGMETRAGSSPFFVEVGARAPLTSDEQAGAVFTGFFSDVTREEAFLQDVVSVVTAINVREVTPSKVAYRLRLSPVLEIPTGGPSESQFYALYSIQIEYHGSYARVGTGMSGRALLSEDFGNLGQRSRNQLEIHADFLPGAWRPGLELRLPLGDVSSAIPVVLGASISWCR